MTPMGAFHCDRVFLAHGKRSKSQNSNSTNSRELFSPRIVLFSALELENISAHLICYLFLLCFVCWHVQLEGQFGTGFIRGRFDLLSENKWLDVHR